MRSKEGWDLDSSGNIITNPLVGWFTADAASGMLVLVAMQYVQNPEQLKTGDHQQIQFVVKPEQCQELAGALTRAAQHAASRRTESGPIH